MPDEIETPAAEPDAGIRYRTLKLPSGRSLRLAVTPKPEPATDGQDPAPVPAQEGAADAG